MTLIQRFGSALNLNIHFHMIFLAGVYLPVEGAQPVPVPAAATSDEYLKQARNAAAGAGATDLR